MATSAPPDPTASVGAKERYKQLNAKLKMLTNTLNAAQAQHGITPVVADQLLRLQDETARFKPRIDGIWNSFNAQREQLSTQLQAANERLRTAPDAKKPGIQAEVDGINQQIQRADLSADQLRTQPSEQLDAAAADLDDLIVRARTLYQEAISSQSLAVAGAATIDVNRDEFKQGRDYHRNQAIWMLILLGLATAAASTAVYFLFVEFPTHLPVNGEHPVPTSDASRLWLEGALLLGGRFSVLLGIGWLLVYIGTMHARHAQQAIWYQDRLAGLDAAKMVLHYGSLPARENLLNQLVTTYLSAETNAFRDPPTIRADGSMDEVVRLMRALRPLLKALAPLRPTTRD